MMDKARKTGYSKIVIFYSSIGYGHISAAQAIQEEISRQSPSAAVLLQDIRAFMPPLWRRIDERLYWFIVNNFPESFDNLFRATQERGNRVPSLSLLPNDYPEQKVLAYLAAQAPDAVLATHYGAAQVLGTLRERGRLPKVRIGWLHTDFFEGYFPRISKRIDRTFLAHAELQSHWLAAGVPKDRIAISGMPVHIPETAQNSREKTLTRLGLALDIPTLMLTGGKEGTGDYPAVVEGIARDFHDSIQIIAVCGNNAKQQTALAQLQEDLPSRVVLKVLGLLPQSEMASCMLAADVLITKAGGLTPAEAFYTGTPTILLDVISGHERENAALFVRLGLAEQASDPTQVGQLVADILSTPGRKEEMLDAQRQFKESANIASIAQFALDEAFTPTAPPLDYGVEDGTPVLDIDEALKQLDVEAPAAVELLLSYATSQTPQRVVLENPFGHIAIRIESTVYSANYVADPSIDPNFLQHMSLADYLYGVQRPSQSQVHTNTYGMAYGRETLGLRIMGISVDRRATMVAETHRIEEEFLKGSLRWNRSDFNCVDVVTRILKAGGYGCSSLYDRVGMPGMPLDLFERMRARFEAEASLCGELVAYRLLPGTQASYRFSRFPLSIGQPLRSAARVLSDTPRDSLERAVTKQITSYFGDRRLYVEGLKACRSASGVDGPSVLSHSTLELEQAILADLRRLLAVYAKLPIKKIDRLGNRFATGELHRLLDHGIELARLATEFAEEMRLSASASHLRDLFTQLVADYGRIRPRRLKSNQVQAYLARLHAFELALGRDFSAPGKSWTKVAWEAWRALQRWIERLLHSITQRWRGGEAE